MRRLVFVSLTLVLLAVASSARGATVSLQAEQYYAQAYAAHYQVPAALVFAIISQESSWRPDVVSDAGAVGLMQVLPATARRYGITDLFNIQNNLSAGVRYLAALIRKFGDLRLAVAAYYCGEHRMARVGYAESNPQIVRYVVSVERRYRKELQREAYRSQYN